MCTDIVVLTMKGLKDIHYVWSVILHELNDVTLCRKDFVFTLHVIL